MKGLNPTIVVVAYNRIHTLERLLKSLKNGVYHVSDITLIISIDYHPSNQKVVCLANEFIWDYGNKIVKTHTENLGLRNHIIECGSYSLEYQSVIVLEDDEYVAPMFYEYTRNALTYYEMDNRIAGVSLYGREWNDYECNRFQPLQDDGDVYFGQFSCTWGQAWTLNQWKSFLSWYKANPDVVCDEKLPPPICSWKKSWGKYFVRYLVENDRYYVIPYKPVCTVYGEQGIHSRRMELQVQNALYWGKQDYQFCDFENGRHYDIFYESVDLKQLLAERYQIDESEICVDLYGLRGRTYGSNRYILTTRKMNQKIIAQYDLNLRPQELNVILEMQGDGIFLYDRNQTGQNKSYHRMRRIEYDMAGVRGPEAIFYGFYHIGMVINQMIHR